MRELRAPHPQTDRTACGKNGFNPPVRRGEHPSSRLGGFIVTGSATVSATVSSQLTALCLVSHVEEENQQL